MWRTISRPASPVAIVVLLFLAGCGGAGQATSAGPATTLPVATTVAPTAPTAPTTLACADVALSSGPYDLAGEIKVIGLSCADAMALIAKVGPQVTPAGGPPRVESDGFVCLPAGSRGTDHGPPSANFQCTSGAKTVTFVRS